MTPMTPTSALLSVNKLAFDYPDQPLFRERSFSLPAGVTLLSGDGGSGKTTLLRLLAGELLPQSGTVCIGDISLTSAPESYRRHVFLFDPRSPAFEAQSELTAAQLFEHLRSSYANIDEGSLPRLAETLGIGEHIGKPLFMLSTGSRRKVWLAAAFASGATVLLLDEPFGALDKPSISAVRSLLDEWAVSPDRGCVVAHYEAPCNAALAATIDLDSWTDS